MTTEELTQEEKKAVAALKRLAKKWPDSLWLFAANGTLNVMKKDEAGRRMTHLDGFAGECSIASIGIECDGGDW